MKKVLLMSYNPVPTDTKKTVEGSGLRFWRMGLGLQKAGIKKIDIGVWYEFNQGGQATNGMNIVSYDGSSHLLRDLTSKYDTVIFSSALSGLSSVILDAIPKNVQAIVDAYSPVYVEFLTKSLDKDGDKSLLTSENYLPFIDAFNECLIRADYVLIGNENQKHFYRGVIGGVGGLLNFDDSKFVTLPAFVESASHINKESKPKKAQHSEKLNILWFGGVYPWFDIKDLIYAFSDKEISKLAKLIVVGGSNPFYPKDNKRFNGKYIEALSLCKKLNLNKSIVEFKDWVDYEDRIEVFNNADLAISINSDFLENEYSFRLRVADLAGNGVPILTNGGDPLGELLLSEGVAFKLDTESKNTIKQSIKAVVGNKNTIEQAKTKLASKLLYDKLHIYRYAEGLAKVINDGKILNTRDTKYASVKDIIISTNNIQTTLPAKDPETIEATSTRRLARILAGRVRHISKEKISGLKKRVIK